MNILKRIPKSIAFLFWMTILTGVLYPLAVTGVAQLAFPGKADGSLIVAGGQVKGSRLLAQEFAGDRFFKPRPSAAGYAYVGSAGSNLAPTNAALADSVKDRIDAWKKEFGSPAPSEMRYASGSGLDPDISLESALGQLDSVSAARGISAPQEEALRAMIEKASAAETTLVGVPRVNVVELNARLETDPAFAASGD
jgi:K+-transporting ATPase ATPase C chain